MCVVYFLLKSVRVGLRGKMYIYVVHFDVETMNVCVWGY